MYKIIITKIENTKLSLQKSKIQNYHCKNRKYKITIAKIKNTKLSLQKSKIQNYHCDNQRYKITKFYLINDNKSNKVKEQKQIKIL